MPWLALTAEIDPAAAEALSEALLQAGAQSVALEPGRLSALLALHEDAGALLAGAARAAGVSTPPYRVERLEDQDWVRSSQAQFEPLAVGERLWVGASWHEPPPGRSIVRLDPGLAFGTGSHPTTRLALAFVEARVRGGERVLDYGCGSGILAIAAARLGADRVDAVDVDPVALETTAANARANQAAVRAALPEGLEAATYDLVIANILAQPLIVLAPLLAERCARGGRIALSGILDGQAAEVGAAYAPWLDMRVSRVEEGWALVEGVRT